jgi:hypothetical protein
MRRLIIAVAGVLASACTHEATLSQPVKADATVAAPVAPSAAAPAATAVPITPVVPASPPPPAPVATTPAPVTAAEPAPAPKAAAAAPARTTPAKPPSPPIAAPAAPVVAAAAAPAAPLDLPLLEQRLKDTRAIGVFTKLSLKNQVDDLLTQFRAYHKGNQGKSLSQLRQSYELLLLKVVSLLQNDDPKLAAAVGSSREAIWGVLVDPKKFASLAA